VERDNKHNKVFFSHADSSLADIYYDFHIVLHTTLNLCYVRQVTGCMIITDVRSSLKADRATFAMAALCQGRSPG
jgi:hypothetical protein